MKLNLTHAPKAGLLLLVAACVTLPSACSDDEDGGGPSNVLDDDDADDDGGVDDDADDDADDDDGPAPSPTPQGTIPEGCDVAEDESTECFECPTNRESTEFLNRCSDTCIGRFNNANRISNPDYDPDEFPPR